MPNDLLGRPVTRDGNGAWQYINQEFAKLCTHCHHPKGRHASSSYLYCSIDDCSCKKFVHYDYQFPRRPTAEEVYELLRKK
jgi:hypothetical protein